MGVTAPCTALGILVALHAVPGQLPVPMDRYLLTIGGKINALRDGLYRQGARPDRQQAGAAFAAALAVGQPPPPSRPRRRA